MYIEVVLLLLSVAELISSSSGCVPQAWSLARSGHGCISGSCGTKAGLHTRVSAASKLK